MRRTEKKADMHNEEEIRGEVMSKEKERNEE